MGKFPTFFVFTILKLELSYLSRRSYLKINKTFSKYLQLKRLSTLNPKSTLSRHTFFYLYTFSEKENFH
jgi:hypothetical protein